MLTLLIFLLILSLLIFVHEFGHFIAARRMGVTVEEFGFGFPPRLFGLKRGNTIYSVNWIPLGGFVKLKGESGELRDHHDSFISKSIGKRAVIISAGVLMNFLLAATLFSVGFMVGLPQEVDGLPRGARVRDRGVAVGQVLDGLPAARADLMAGDTIVSIDGKKFEEAEAARTYIREHGENPLSIEARRGRETVTAVMTPEVLPQTGKPGIGVELFSSGIVSYPWYRAPLVGLQVTGQLILQILQAFGNLIQGLVFDGRVEAGVSGPVGIAVLTGEAAALGWSYLLSLAAILSLNLGVINFFPIPALDGGRFLFLLIERVRGRPVSRQLEAIIHQVGFALLIVPVILVTYRDVSKLFR